MKAFVGLFAGENMSNCSLLATSANRRIIKTVADLLSGKSPLADEKMLLRKLRHDRGWKIMDVSGLSGGAVKPHRVSAIERGKPAMAGEAQALSEVFNLPIEELGVVVSQEVKRGRQ